MFASTFAESWPNLETGRGGSQPTLTDQVSKTRTSEVTWPSVHHKCLPGFLPRQDISSSAPGRSGCYRANVSMQGLSFHDPPLPSPRGTRQAPLETAPPPRWLTLCPRCFQLPAGLATGWQQQHRPGQATAALGSRRGQEHLDASTVWRRKGSVAVPSALPLQAPPAYWAGSGLEHSPKAKAISFSF